MTKYFFTATLATLLASSAAVAGGMNQPVMESSPEMVAPMASVGNWAGGYAGANLNWGKASADALSFTFAEPDGIAGSIRAGYDWQSGQAVFGVGAEYNFGKYKAGWTDEALAVDDFPGTVDDTFTVDKMATIFVRAGYAVNDQFLAYGLLGYSRADASATAIGESGTEKLDGMTLGLGGEYKFNQNWSAYGEYAYTDFGSLDNSFDLIKVDLHQVKIGMNYRF